MVFLPYFLHKIFKSIWYIKINNKIVGMGQPIDTSKNWVAIPRIENKDKNEDDLFVVISGENSIIPKHLLMGWDKIFFYVQNQ